MIYFKNNCIAFKRYPFGTWFFLIEESDDTHARVLSSGDNRCVFSSQVRLLICAVSTDLLILSYDIIQPPLHSKLAFSFEIRFDSEVVVNDIICN